MPRCASLFLSVVITLLSVAGAAAQAVGVAGTVRDQTGDALPGVAVELMVGGTPAGRTQTDTRGAYRFDNVPAGRAVVSFALINFGTVRREIDVTAPASRVDAILQLSLSADVTVTGKSTFTNLADVERPAENVIGVAQSASQGAITARQLEARPVMRTGEVLETVPGVVISQHSGEGKANQYYLRGFNLDHGTDFSTTVAGLPVNMPTHGHGHGYSDLNFLIPELISGVQVLEGPVLRRPGGLRHRRRRQHQLHQQPGPADRPPRRRRPGLRPRARRRVDSGRYRDGPRGGRSAAQRRPVARAGRLPESERAGALQLRATP